MGMVVHAPKAKNDRIIDLFLVLDPNRTQADMGRIQRYGTRIWQSEMSIDHLGPGGACMVPIVHVRGVHATHTPAQRLIPGRRYARFQVGNFRGQQLLFMIAAVETVSRLTLLELAEPELRTFLLTVSAPEVYVVRLGPQVFEVAE